MDQDVTDVIIACAVYAIVEKKKKKRLKRYWVHPVYRAREEEGEFHTLFSRLRDDPEKFRKYFRMSYLMFENLLQQCTDSLNKKNTTWRRSISAKERLALTLRYLAAGDSQISLSFSYRISPTAVHSIIISTCKTIWRVLAPNEFPKLNKDDWITISDDFNRMWHFPNCIGALDGKHVVIQAPPNSGSLFYNYKGTFSIVLLALVDANYRFIAVDIGGYGKASDGGILANSILGQKLESGSLNIPNSKLLETGGDPLPFVIVGDEAFPLKTYLMRPYPRSKASTMRSQALFNYRLCRARRVVENAFGILVQRFRVLYNRLQVYPKNADAIVQACVVLHNFMRNDILQEQLMELEDIHSGTGLEPLQHIGTHSSVDAINTRHKFRRYFAGRGKVPWQEAIISSRGHSE